MSTSVPNTTEPKISTLSRLKQHKKWFKRLGIAAVPVFALALGQTFAANISLGNSGQVEFGQGVQVLAACSGSSALTLTPEAEFVNEVQGGEHYLKSITVTNVPSSCAETDFTIKVYGSSGPALVTHGTDQNRTVVYFDGTTFSKGAGSGYTVTGTSSSFTITYTDPVAVGSDVQSITIESGGHTVLTCLNGGSCTPGNRGPGGGTVFYSSVASFSVPGSPCGNNCHYLEYAPVNWGDGISVESYEYSGTSSEWPSLRWCTGTGYTNYVTTLHTTDRDWVRAHTFGLGYSATAAMADNCTSGAGKVAFDLNFGGRSDWFLPSMSEFNELCKFVRGSDGLGDITIPCADGTLPAEFPATHYWTSTESDETPGGAAYLFHMSPPPHPDDDLKGYTGKIVPIRAFG